MQRRIVSSRQRSHEILEELRLGGRPSTPSPDSDGLQQRHRTATQLIQAFWNVLAGQRGQLGLALVLGSIATLLSFVPPAATKLVIDNVIGAEPLPAMLRSVPGLNRDHPEQLLAGILVIAFVFSSLFLVFQLYGRWIATLVTKRVLTKLRRDCFDHAIRLPLHRVQALKSGGTSSLLRDDTGGVAELVFGLIYNPWRSLLQLVGSLVILAIVDWRLLLGACVLIPVLFLTHRTWIGRIRPMYRASRRSRQQMAGQSTETFGGIRVVRAFGRQASETLRFILSNNLVIRQELHVWWSSRMVEVAWGMLIPAASSALLWYGGSEVLAGRLSLGELMMFLVYLTMLLKPLAVLADNAATFQNNLSALDRVLDLLDEPQEMAAASGDLPLDLHRARGELILEDVGFHYPGHETPVLQEISLHVRPGQIVALVGTSGAGKTTLTNLIARFYNPTSGRILLDGVDISGYDIENYRRILGIVEQDVFLFDGTIGENIAFGRPSATDEEIIEAARAANATEFIERLPKQYDTRIGERGVKLSGGQRQRLAIARAILADPKLLILDEATSNLDSESELLIQQSLASLMSHRTCFVIAHRLSTIRHADQIVVLERGRVVEVGTHADLLQRASRYRRMLELQASHESYADLATI